MSKKIVLSGYYGFNNAGDEAILMAIISSLKQLSNLEILVFSGDPKVTSIRHDVNSVHRFNVFAVIKSFIRSDLFISGGGSLLQDVTSIKSLLYYLSLIVLGNIFSKRVMLYAQGIGPIERKWLRKLTNWVLKYVDMIAVRDIESKNFLINFGVDKKKIQLTADAVFLLPQIGLQDGKVLLSRYGIDESSNLVGVAIRSWHNDKYLGALVDALDALADAGKKIFLIPLQYSVDVVVARKLQKAMRHDVKILEKEYTIEELLSLVGNMELIIGMRLHSLIFAAVMGVPFVALNYDPKVTAFVNMVQGIAAGDVDNLTTDKILDACRQAVNVKVDLCELRRQAEINNNIVEKLLEGSLVKC